MCARIGEIDNWALPFAHVGESHGDLLTAHLLCSTAGVLRSCLPYTHDGSHIKITDLTPEDIFDVNTAAAATETAQSAENVPSLPEYILLIPIM